MKKFFTFLLTLISFNTVLAQTSSPSIKVDTSTYNAYINGDWNRVIDVGNQAIEDGIDYYYLRLRLAYAFFMKENYRLAISHYQKALEFSHRDPTALEYLYYCYLYSGRKNDTEILVKQFPQTLKKHLKTKSTNRITSIGFFATYGTGSIDNLKDDIPETIPLDINGIQILPKSLINYNLNITHQFGYHIQIHHSLNLLYKDQYTFSAEDSELRTSGLYTLRQFEYHVGVDYIPFEGFTIEPVFSYLNYSIPVTEESSVSNGRRTQTSNGNITFNEYIFGLKLTKEFGLFSATLGGVHSNINQGEQNTGALGVSIYPFGNLNLYYTATGYLHAQSDNSSSETQFVQSHKIGIKIINNLWIEGLYMFGDFRNFYDSVSELTYNGQELYKNIGGINLIIPFYESGISVFLGYRAIHSESILVPIDNVLESYNHKSFNFQTFFGGITWQF